MHRIDRTTVAVPPTHPEMLGRIGRYEVERLLGSGGMGVVFKAFDTELNRPVAVKVLAPYLAGTGAARNRFAREARAAAAVVDEHVVAIHNVEVDGTSPFLVMQYIAGESLQSRIDRCGSLELCEILRIAIQTAGGLAAAHDQGLVHRDVKPSNIMLENGVERALLTDFGLARAADDATITRSGYHPGTPHYMSPEQARGEAIDARSDLFSLGSVMYAMCTGRVPFRAETGYGIMRRIIDTDPRPIREINSAIPTWLCQLVDRLHAKSPEDRYPSAQAVEHLLQQCLAHVQTGDTPLPDGSCFQQSCKPRRHLLPRFMIGGASVAVIGSVLCFFSGGVNEKEPEPPSAGPAHAISNSASRSETADVRLWNDGLSNALTDVEAWLASLDSRSQRPFGEAPGMRRAGSDVLLSGEPVVTRAAELRQAPNKLPGGLSDRARYCLLVFGEDAEMPVWMIQESGKLYVDLNANGDLSEPNEVFLKKERADFPVEGVKSRGFFIPASVHCAAELRGYFPLHVNWQDTGKNSLWVRLKVDNRFWQDAVIPVSSTKPEYAPILHLDGPLQCFLLHPKRTFVVSDHPPSLTIAVGTVSPTGDVAYVDLDDAPLDSDSLPELHVQYFGAETSDPQHVVHSGLEPDPYGGYLISTLRVSEEMRSGDIELTVSAPRGSELHFAPFKCRLPLTTALAAPDTDDNGSSEEKQ